MKNILQKCYLCHVQNKYLSLYELNKKIKDGLENLFPFPVWIVAEISELSVSNHCYLELVERSGEADKIVAKARAMIWSYTYNMLKPYFETTTGYELAAGLKVLVKVEVQFNEIYGFSLSVKDIDPNYTLGDIQQRKQLILQQLADEGILEMNKELEFPSLPKRIAIISSEKAAGYQDFINQLTDNSSGFCFLHKLYPAMMQGEQTSTSIRRALEQIYNNEDLFDVVVLIRGGGAVSDLSFFDDYELAAHLAQFPLPILTGIGHDKDQSVADEVAYRSLKTPTAVADFLIDCLEDCEENLQEAMGDFYAIVKNKLQEKKQVLETSTYSLKYMLPSLLKERRQGLTTLAKELNHITLDKLSVAKSEQQKLHQKLKLVLSHEQNKAKEELSYLQRKLIHRSTQFLTNKRESLLHKEEVIDLLSPQKLLERGYSITTYRGKVLKSKNELRPGDEVETQLASGTFKSTVK